MNSANANGKGLTPNGQTKKTLVIKPLKLKPKLRENFEDETWAKLEDAVNAVHAKRPVSYGLEQLYRAVEDMCIHKMQDAHHTLHLLGAGQDLRDRPPGDEVAGGYWAAAAEEAFGAT